jgi:catechol 2,3-dioxygenase-like lactoylglutathione lyase family enzyme
MEVGMTPALAITRSNTIVYTRRWQATVPFYEQTLGLVVSFRNDWFVEFELAPGSYLSLADARRRAAPRPRAAEGLTLSWQVADLSAVRRYLQKRGVVLGPVQKRWGARTTDIHDPAGHRIELWQAPPAGHDHSRATTIPGTDPPGAAG